MTYITHYCEFKYKNPENKTEDKDIILCGAPLTEHAYNYSMQHYDKALCFGHQRQTDDNAKSYKEGYASQKDYDESNS